MVVDVGALVGAGDNHRLVRTYMAVTACQLLDEFVARNSMDVAETLEPYLGQLENAIFHQPSDLCGVPKNARLLTLA